MAKYMVVYLDVEDGEVQGVYGSDKLKEVDSAGTTVYEGELPHLAAVDKIKKIKTFYAKSSPGCRYVQVGGIWVKICT